MDLSKEGADLGENFPGGARAKAREQAFRWPLPTRNNQSL